MLEHIHWLGHASVRLDFDKTIYVDPWRLDPTAPKADLVLITHDHHDHFSPDDIAIIEKEGTSYVTIEAVASRLRGDVRTVRPGDSITVQGVGVQVVPAYNVDKQFHPKSAGHVGFLLETGGHTIYIAGDTDFTPEMREVRADAVLLPVGGRYTMSADEAAQAANFIRPRLAIPLHYGTIVGSSADASRFKRLCQVPVHILEPERP